jgi:hypothetical protein
MAPPFFTLVLDDRITGSLPRLLDARGVIRKQVYKAFSRVLKWTTEPIWSMKLYCTIHEHFSTSFPCGLRNLSHRWMGSFLFVYPLPIQVRVTLFQSSFHFCLYPVISFGLHVLLALKQRLGGQNRWRRGYSGEIVFQRKGHWLPRTGDRKISEMYT